MSSWLYQLSPDLWNPERYRFEIWEGERWHWPVGVGLKRGVNPKPGDTIIFFYSPSRGSDPGFYGWATVLEWHVESDYPLYFRPSAPSDWLKMDPWWNEDAKKLADEIRGKLKQGTIWQISDDHALALRTGITNWLSRSKK